ncbi:MAG: hypothetical protein AAGF06_06475 [Pseudomonadota bacterium]
MNRILFYTVLISSVCLSACMPSAPQTVDPSPRAWTDAEVDELVTWNKVTIHKPLPDALKAKAPEACNYINFLRIKLKDAPVESSKADAVFMMMPGVLEGATAFKYIGRQMAYLAKTQHNKNVEIWGMDRRSNCLEDVSILDDVEQLTDATKAGEMLIDYYFKKVPVKGKRFNGIYDDADVSFLSEFGIQLATEDMFSVMNYMMPQQADRQKKLFVGGHSLGGIHTSVFLSWDLDGDEETLEDAGYNNVAGAFGFDTTLADLSDMPDFATQIIPFGLGNLGVGATELLSPGAYKKTVDKLTQGQLPLTTSIEGVFDQFALAFMPLFSAVAQIDPKGENTLLATAPLELQPSLETLLTLFQPLQTQSDGRKASMKNFRLTNEAIIGAFFDDDFAPIGFLGTSLGHMKGGALKPKNTLTNALAKLPLFNLLAPQLALSDIQYMPTEHNLNGNGPLYGWANFDEVASKAQPEYKDAQGKVYTTAEDEMADMGSFINSLHDRKTNLNFTEWYFPTRLMVDIVLAVPFKHAVSSGINVLHQDRIADVPKIEFIGKDGILPLNDDDEVLIPTSDNVVVLPGQNHVDPMFEVVNAPERHTALTVPMLLDFSMKHAK